MRERKSYSGPSLAHISMAYPKRFHMSRHESIFEGSRTSTRPRHGLQNYPQNELRIPGSAGCTRKDLPIRHIDLFWCHIASRGCCILGSEKIDRIVYKSRPQFEKQAIFFLLRLAVGFRLCHLFACHFHMLNKEACRTMSKIYI